MSYRPAQHLEKDWLYQKYIVEGLSMVDIGHLVDRDPKTIFQWMRKYQIPTRPRGSDPRQHFHAGDPRSFTGRKHSEATKQKIGEQSRARKQVPYLRNGVHFNKGKRGAVVANWKGGITPERQAFYRSEEWKEAVKAIWKRDNATCQRCCLHYGTVDRKTTKRFHIHHIVSFAAVELRCSLNNLVLLCHNCHMWVHSRANVDHQFIAEIQKP
jgi:hypothetical protein